jgi:hypothetical protein
MMAANDHPRRQEAAHWAFSPHSVLGIYLWRCA